MTNEEITLMAVGVIQEPSEIPAGLYAPSLREHIEDAIREAVIKAYEEAQRGVCTCFMGQETGTHHDFCPAFKIAPLKASLTAKPLAAEIVE
jgi:hypothetical protein